MKAHLTEEQVLELKAQLLARREERREELRKELLAEYDKDQDNKTTAHEVRHGGEEYFEKLLNDVVGEISDLRVQEIRDIDAALQRVASGRYGTCLYCEEPIGFERLQAFPVAKLCLECKADDERQKKP